MTGKAMRLILKRVSGDITETRELLDSSAALLKSLDSPDLKCLEKENDMIEKTKNLVDLMEGKITSMHSYFYKQYNIWKNRQESCAENESKSESSESEGSVNQTSCVVDDSFNLVSDTTNVTGISDENENSNKTVDITSNLKDKMCSSTVDVNNVETDANIVNTENIVDIAPNLEENMRTSTVDVNNIDANVDIANAKDSVDKESTSNANVENKNDSNVLGSDEIRPENSEIQNISNSLNNDASVDISPERKSSNINEHTEAVDKNSEVTADDVQVTADVVNSDNIDSSNKDNCGDNSSDPLYIDHNSMTTDVSNGSITSKSEEVKSEPNTVMGKGSLKIKCVDIKKLLDPETISPDTETISPDIINASVVVISDSDNECSSKRNSHIPNTLLDNSNITITRVSKNRDVSTAAKKKIIVLDDSDSNDDVIQNKKKTGAKAHSPNKKTVKFNLRSLKSEETSSKTSNTRRYPRRKVTQDLSNVSSLSENSSPTSDSENNDVAQSKKKIKVRKNIPVDNTILLKAQQDEKFACKAYVPLTRISAEQLKANYEKKVMKMDIERLTNLKSLKRRRRNSDASEGTETNRERKRHRSKDEAKNPDEDSTDCEASTKNSLEPNSDTLCDGENNTSEPDPKKNETDIAEALLAGINSDNSNVDACSDSEEQNKEKEEVASPKEQENEKKKEKKDDKSASKEDKKSDEDESDARANKEKKKWRKDKLLTENITESDSEEDFAKFMKKRDKRDEQMSDTEAVTPDKSQKRLKKQRRKNVLGSDSDSKASTRSRSDLSTDKSSSSDSESSDNKEKKKKTTRRRIKKMKDSSDSESQDDDKSTRKNIRKVWKNDSLSETTIAAEKEEQERKQRIAERQKKYNQIFEADSLEKSSVDKVILDFNEETEEELLKIDPKIVKHLKPHQAKGVQFMWNTCFESLSRTEKTKGSGCILAHCMGLGKTLQVIALIHTLIVNQVKTGIKKVLVVCPLSTVLNWVAEFKKWLPDDEVEIFELVSLRQNTERMYQVKEWDRIGGALILGYDMFRNLTNSTNKRLNRKMRNTFQTCLVDPGPQLVVCDEGHLLKNEKTSLSIAMNRLQSLRRIVLTGTPLQNNLKEYFCMVQFVKPNLLGTYKEYLNRFVNPIINGQYTDSTPHDIQIMRKRSHVLHKLLDGVVQRKDYSVLAPFLPPKYEYVLFVSLTEIQIKLYEHYMKERSRRNSGEGGRSFLFVDFNEFQRICTHPRVLLDKTNELKAKDKKDFLDDESEGSLKEFIDDDEDSENSTTSSSSSKDSDSGSDGSHKKKKKTLPSKQRITRATPAIYKIPDEETNKPEEPGPSEWWRQFCNDDDLDNLCHGGKLVLLFEILRHCEMIGDKVLVFSQSLYSLNIIEYFLSKVDEATQNSETNSFCGFSGSWSLGLDYFRLDGSSSCDNRAASCKMFNDPNNTRARLFLISTRAGGLGINLVAANRVIIFDVSWNPSHDTQSIYRVYRFGQTKPSYIYRFVTLGTMEMKVYERQVIKQAISKRVIDEQQIDRHYNQNDLAELYKFEPVPEEERPIPLVPKDVLLGELLQTDKKIYKYHEHQILLENKVDEVLDEEERKAAWEEFENEKLARSYTGTINNYPVQMLRVGIQSILRKENPTWQNDLILQETALTLKRIEEEVQMGPSPLFQRVIAEIRVLQQAQENYYKMVQQQQALLQFRQQLAQQYNYSNRMPTATYSRHPNGMPTNGMPSAAAFRQASLSQNPTEYVDLND